ncbi:5'-nucleosidase [Steroidobacter cummioxidans]|uniref:5'-nucleosidase n=1 Tax=Steroidobacter cummioxidans TaxID=1803913 RepID=UPI000E30F814|nr:5'-nucleosidase [Steroidobacter cummioxidans]
MTSVHNQGNPDPLLVMALPLESQGVFERANIPVLYTGIGKVNAAYALTKRLSEYVRAGRPMPQVINFGTAGSRRHVTGSILECHIFVQRDMDVTGLGVPLGVTPFEDAIPSRLEFPRLFPQLPGGECGSGDSFVMSEIAMECDVMEMEAYALAKVCWLERVAFTAVKYVTDGADHASGQDWHANLKLAADQFLLLYRRFRGEA